MKCKQFILLFFIWLVNCNFSFCDEITMPKMNQIQVIGTHNSYHKRPQYLSWAKEYVKETKDWDYEHLPLDLQLNNGVRSFELDIHNTPEGWKVMHVPKFDDTSTCSNLQECLRTIREWSDQNPWHVPISVLIEWKDEGPLIDKRITIPTKEDIERIEEDILAVWSKDRIITPDSVRGDFKTLEEAILNKGWPTLDEVRGKIMFIFHNREKLREMYLDGHPNLENRLMFVNSRPGEPYSATVIIDNPFHEEIPIWVQKGYFIRVFGGNPKSQGAEKLKIKDAKAFSCGAQVISTDNPPGEPYQKTGYLTIFPDGSTVRWNPINGPADNTIPPEKK